MKNSYGNLFVKVLMIVLVFTVFIGVQQSIAQTRNAEIVVDPRNKINISGNLKIALAWGDLLRPPSNLTRGIINLKEAMNTYTKINTELEQHLLLGSNQLLTMPFVFVSSKDNFNLSEPEKQNIKKFFDLGGFMVLDNPEPVSDMSRGGASLKQMIRDSIPNARFQPIPNNHEIYHCFFDFTDGPPNGSEMGMTGAGRSKQVLYLEGVWYRGRLVAVYSDKGYIIKWNEDSGNEPQLKMGVNLIVYALTQEGGMVR
ncbi:DUF4159 domain-containing protein [Candidatus Latescibacterota bacterium]